MAGSRLHKLSSIFDRLTGLIKSQVVTEENIPYWYNIYKRYPPKLNPVYDQAVEMISIKPIFYPEDNLRVKIHAEVPNIIMDLSAKPDENITFKCQVLMDKGLTMKKAIEEAPGVHYMNYNHKSSEENVLQIDGEHENKDQLPIL